MMDDGKIVGSIAEIDATSRKSGRRPDANKRLESFFVSRVMKQIMPDLCRSGQGRIAALASPNPRLYAFMGVCVCVFVELNPVFMHLCVCVCV